MSWNYDYQLELSHAGFLGNKTENSYTFLNAASLQSSTTSIYHDKFGLFKLNGSARYKYKDDKPTNDFSFMLDDLSCQLENYSFLDLLIFRYRLMFAEHHNGKPLSVNELSFAWEHSFEGEFYSKLAISLQETTILVVIGYSFPMFNRSVDKMILNHCVPKLRRVYLQDPLSKAIHERFCSLKPDFNPSKITLLEDTSQFAFPTELDI